MRILPLPLLLLNDGRGRRRASGLEELLNVGLESLRGGGGRVPAGDLAVLVDEELAVGENRVGIEGKRGGGGGEEERSREVSSGRKGQRYMQSTYVKFHLILVVPSNPGFSFLRYLKTSFVESPLTSDFFMRGKVTPWLRVQNEATSSSVPGSWDPNWLQGLVAERGQRLFAELETGDRRARSCSEAVGEGVTHNPRTTRPWSLYFW